jgi:uncharacterized membrane protein
LNLPASRAVAAAARKRGAMPDRIQARLAVFTVVILNLLLPDKLAFGPVWAAPLAAAVLLVPIVALTPRRNDAARLLRTLTTVLIAVLNIFNIGSVVHLIYDLVNTHAAGHATINGIELLEYGAIIWVTNVLVFALWFWELDGLGPFDRDQHPDACDSPEADFLFPQMTIDRTRVKGVPNPWRPLFVDYLYVSFTNALAISPTDTMPLTRTAKMGMLAESLISFTTVALILARSVNILS